MTKMYVDQSLLTRWKETLDAFIERTSGGAGIVGNGTQAFSPNTTSNIMLSNARPASP
jgi:hypothetical protein